MASERHILVVEDSQLQRTILALQLSSRGYRVSQAPDGQQALEVLQGQPVDLVISDIDMPEMDGFALCQAIKADERLRRTPVILLTALTDTEDIIRGLNCGADSYVTKPWEEEYLAIRVESLLATFAGQGELTEVVLDGKRYRIDSDQQQILNLLVSTFEAAVEQNKVLRRANEELNQVQRDLARRSHELMVLNQEKNKFLGMAAHDLRGPLTVILGFARLLRAHPTADQFIDAITRSSEHMLTMVEELLDISAIESGELRLNLEPVDFTQLVERCVSLQALVAEPKRIDLEFSHDPDLPRLQGDASKLEQVVSNLLSNAVKYSPPETTVRVALVAAGDHLELSVTDQGPGISAEEAALLFKPFQRTSNRPTGGEKSIGLGLAIAKRMVEGHRGRIRVDSKVGDGSTFSVSLPVE